MHVGMAEVLRERNDLDAAQRHLLASVELGEHAGLPQNAYRSRVALAKIRQAEGDLTAAVGLLEEAERLYTGDYSPDVRPVSALKARIYVAQGKVGDALSWAAGRHLSASDPLSYLHEFEHITLARILLAEDTGRDNEGAQLLERLLTAARDGHRTGSVIEILVLQALDRHARNDLPGALAALEDALALAEPEGHVRVFLDEGTGMVGLLRIAVREGRARRYAERLLSAGVPPARSAPPRGGLVEELSTRELDVLRLLRSDMSGPDIARELMVSLNTFRTHTKNIYAKLAVNNRREAVRRAAELGL
jgi:LuxR family maltose regulon positive regulatory protein